MSKKKLPRQVPKTARSIHGPIKVVWVTSKQMKKLAGQFAWGLSDYAERTMYLNERMREEGTNPIMMWKTFHHEAHHFHMEDAGLNQILGEQRELICEAYAQVRLDEMLHGKE